MGNLTVMAGIFKSNALNLIFAVVKFGSVGRIAIFTLYLSGVSFWNRVEGIFLCIRPMFGTLGSQLTKVSEADSIDSKKTGDFKSKKISVKKYIWGF